MMSIYLVLVLVLVQISIIKNKSVFCVSNNIINSLDLSHFKL